MYIIEPFTLAKGKQMERIIDIPVDIQQVIKYEITDRKIGDFAIEIANEGAGKLAALLGEEIVLQMAGALYKDKPIEVMGQLVHFTSQLRR